MYREIDGIKLKDPTLQEAQKFVGGWVELVRVKDGVLLVNEEAKLKRLEANPEATQKYTEMHGSNDIILGPAIFIPESVKSEWIR